ncbi:MAG: GNAT family N-acetyltransferase [Candidatus Acidiferrales bacterium]
MIHPPLQQVEPGTNGAQPSKNPGGSFSAAGIAKRLNIIDPLTDTRWDDLVATHTMSSAFHRRGWLEALKHTYGYEPLVLTSASAEEPLTDGIAACRVSSWLTGTRLVSLPFADHCDPLFGESSEELLSPDRLVVECTGKQYKYLEFRPSRAWENLQNQFQPFESFYFHELDLRPSLGQLFKALHKDSIQRKIRRAEKEKLSYEAGRSDELIQAFYDLQLITRRRHHLPPQPKSWFQNVAKYMGEAVHIRVARKNGVAIAAILTLRHRSTVIYKYGCSDGAFHQLGGMPFLFWKVIEESKASGADRLDFGRSEMDNEGLVAFKDKFGTTKRTLTYYRYPGNKEKQVYLHENSRLMRRMLCMFPDGVLSAVGRVLYKHIG